MTVSTQVSRNEYTGNGATTQYDFTFRILDKSHLLVQTLDTSESIVTLTLGTDYTVTGVNRYNGGKVVLTSALPAGYKISIERSTPVTQEASIRNQGGFFPEIHEDAFDKLTMLVQQAYGWWSGLSLRKPSWLANYYDALNNRIRNLRDPSQAQDAATKSYVDSSDIDLQQQITSNFNRSLRVPDSYISQLPSAQDRAWKGLGFDGAGQPKLQDPAGTGLWGYVPAIGSFEQGSLLTQRFEVLLWESTDEYWRWDGVMPKVVLPGSTPATAGGTGKGKWIDVTDATLRANLGSGDGLKLIGQCENLDALRAVEPSFNGQQIYLRARVSGWGASASGMPWGGGKLRHIASLPAELQIDDGGSIIKTSGGKCWVREELLSGLGEIRVEWYLDGAPSFTVDASDAFQAAADTAKLWAQYSGRNSTVRLVMPPKMYITKTINVYSRGVRIDGNHGYCKALSTGNYTAYSSLSTNTYITTTPDSGATARAVINLTHGASPGVPNPAYSDQELIKDWNMLLGTSGDHYNPIPPADNGIVAICHWATSSVAGAQFSMRNCSFQGFGVGYINGDQTWGGNFYECKWAGCYIPMWLIRGNDNQERFTLFGCVMQNGYRCVYSTWGGDFNIVKGSYVWNTGPYFEFPNAGFMIDINPSRIETMNASQPLLKVATAVETGAVSQTYPLVKLHGATIVLAASTLQPANYLFSVSKFSKLVVRDNVWHYNSMETLANLKLLNPADTGGKVRFINNTARVGIFSEMARDNRLLTSTTPAGRIESVTLGGGNAANATVTSSGANLTLTVNTTALGTMTLLLKVVVDVDMTDWDSFSWKAVFNNVSIASTWAVTAFASVTDTKYVNNRVDLGSVVLNDVSDITDVCSKNSYGWRRIQKRADGGWDRVPTEFYLYFSCTNQTAGDTFTLNRLGLLGY